MQRFRTFHHTNAWKETKLMSTAQTCKTTAAKTLNHIKLCNHILFHFVYNVSSYAGNQWSVSSQRLVFLENLPTQKRIHNCAITYLVSNAPWPVAINWSKPSLATWRIFFLCLSNSGVPSSCKTDRDMNSERFAFPSLFPLAHWMFT